MAKRKRLSPANPEFMIAPERSSEHKSAALPSPGRGGPIADVARDAASSAALAELSEAMGEARRSGKLVVEIPLAQVIADHLVRDRAHVDAAEMEALMASLSERGQQTPIEVVELAPERYGLISGWRRLEALRKLGIPQVAAFLRRPQDGAAAYVAMVEENEIRADLSFFERARIVVKAVEAGAFPDERAALRELFCSVPRARRSKIGSFVPLVKALDGILEFPQALSEKRGLILARAVERDTKLVKRIADTLCNRASSAAAEWNQIERCMTPVSPARPAPAFEESPTILPSSGLRLHRERPDRIVLEGSALSDSFLVELTSWLEARRVGD